MSTDRTQNVWLADMTKGHKTEEMKTKTNWERERKDEEKKNIRGDFIKKKTPAAVLVKLEEKK